MTERVGPDQSAANEDLSPAERLAVMQTQHRTLDQKIIELQSRPWPNQLLVQRLKKEKLRLKESIERLKNDITPDLHARSLFDQATFQFE